MHAENANTESIAQPSARDQPPFSKQARLTKQTTTSPTRIHQGESARIHFGERNDEGAVTPGCLVQKRASELGQPTPLTGQEFRCHGRAKHMLEDGRQPLAQP